MPDNEDACNGDSGGALVTYDDEVSSFVQIGIVSFGKYCGHERYPGVYVRVTSQLEWIKSHITGQTCPPPATNAKESFVSTDKK